MAAKKTKTSSGRIARAIERARYLTEEAAAVPDWKLRTVKDKKNKKLAKQLLKGKGYIVAEMEEGYSPRKKKHIMGYSASIAPYSKTKKSIYYLGSCGLTN